MYIPNSLIKLYLTYLKSIDVNKAVAIENTSMRFFTDMLAIPLTQI